MTGSGRREVRLVDPDGNQLGIKPLPEALSIARELELDLVEVAPLADPPVCRILNYGKWKYEAARREKESRRKATNAAIKEMKYRPKIGGGDFDTKTRKVGEFIEQTGHKPKPLVHDGTLLPRHAPSSEGAKVSPMCPEYRVTYLSGRTLKKTLEIKSARPLGSYRVVSVSNQASAVKSRRNILVRGRRRPARE